jgi:predicted Na+-dependent transporter
MTFTLIDDFKTKYPKYWSVWCNVAAGILSVFGLLDYFGVMLPLFETRLSPAVYVGLSIICTLAGLFARAIKQSSLNPVDAEVADAPAK